MVDYSWEEIEFVGVKDMNERLTGKVIIVTGAESGIGRSIVQRCIIDGACVTAAGLNVEDLKETANLCAETGGEERLIWTETDVRETASVNGMINQTKKTLAG
ncbi:MAG: SDR family NAD(P)-dependent oxidoreductase [Rhodospirillales bacterium]